MECHLSLADITLADRPLQHPMPCIQVASVLESIVTIGMAVGLASRAHRLVKELRRRLRQVSRQVAGEVRPRVVSLEGLSPLVLGGHWLPEMKAVAGGVEGLQEPGEGAKKVAWERVTAFAPEVLILAPCSASLERTLSEVGIGLLLGE